MCTLAPLQYIVGNVPSDRTYLEQGEVLKCFLIHANEIETNKPLHSCTLSTFRVPMVKLTQFHTGSFSYQVEDRHIPFSQLCLLKHVKLWKCSLTGMGKDTWHFATSCQCSGYLTDSWLLLISMVSANWVKLAWTTATEREKERHWKRSRGNDREGWEHMQDTFRTLLLL